MKIFKFAAIATIALLAHSCGKPEKVENAEKVVAAFFKALKNSDSATLKTLYPDFSKLPAFYKSDTIVIKGYDRNKGNIDIEVQNSFTNIKKEKFSQIITMVVSGDENNMRILDSRGLCNFKGQDLYDFGTKTGCVSKDTTLSDQTIVKQMEKAEKFMLVKAKELIQELKDSVPVTELQTKELFGYVSGTARMTNHSPYPLYFVKYEITLSNSQGNELKREDGYATVDTLAPGQDKQITFFIQPPEGTSHLDLRLVYDNYFLLECLASKKWTGKECEDFK
jgi:hypothetical protein